MVQLIMQTDMLYVLIPKIPILVSISFLPLVPTNILAFKHINRILSTMYSIYLSGLIFLCPYK